MFVHGDSHLIYISKKKLVFPFIAVLTTPQITIRGCFIFVDQQSLYEILISYFTQCLCSRINSYNIFIFLYDFQVSAFLAHYFSEVTDYSFTADMETEVYSLNVCLLFTNNIFQLITFKLLAVQLLQHPDFYNGVALFYDNILVLLLSV